MAVKHVSQPANTPVTLDELKAHLRVTSTSEDILIQAALEAAIDEISTILSRAMITQDFEQTFHPVAGLCDVELDVTPVQSLLSVDLVKADNTKVSGDLQDYELISDGERYWVRAVNGWPSGLARRPDAITLKFRAGFGDQPADIPATLRAAVQLLAAHRFEVREEVVIGTIASTLPRGVDHLLDLHRIRRFG